MTHEIVNIRYRQYSDALHSAGSTDEVITAYLKTVGEVIPAAAHGVYELDTASLSVIRSRSNSRGNWLDLYEEYGRQDDPVLQFVLKQGRAVDSSRLLSDEQWESSGARKALSFRGLAHSLEAPVVVSGVFFGTINLARPAEFPAFSSAELHTASLVSEQLAIALERALHHETTGRRVSTLERTLDRLGQAVIVTTLEGQVLYQNRTALREWGVEVDVEGSPLPGATADAIVTAMSEFRGLGKRVSIRNLEDERLNRRAVMKSYRLSDSEDTAVSLIFPYADGPAARQLPVWDVLTRREQEIAQLVSEGLTTKQISGRAFISENTTKQHLKRIFVKTGVSSRAELIQLIWTSGHANHTN
ncbi:LuxR C-terminal-related transcriptional regulator [Rhodoglobus vestalii]|uniref:LuxR C-terminal-related transcriptional regulator n=1 Tax=Rhodoglobus vestalii TaxID=193384 RepID=UPI0011503975|nr:LuxR C-terminal-related transcriptional regulator [Rhodoglobus vestalii]